MYLLLKTTLLQQILRVSQRMSQFKKNHVVELKVQRTKIVGGTSSRGRVRQNTARNTDMNELDRLDGEIYTANQLLKHENEKQNDAKKISHDYKEVFVA